MKTKSLMLASGATMAGVLTLSAPAVAAPPEPFTIVGFTIEEDAPLGSCDFDVRLDATGKAKTITTPTGKVIGVSANTTATLTNESGESVQYSVNGTLTSTTDSDGNVTTKATGRNLLTDPVAGVVVTSGNFTFTFDEEGNLAEVLSGTGKIIDVCAALS